MKKIAIFGGAFNPVTIGHIQTAQFVLDSSIFEEVWLMPYFKNENKQMESPQNRINMCNLSVEDQKNIYVCNYEINNELKRETIHLFEKLKEEKIYENYEFSMVIGMDQANNFYKWVNFSQLEKKVQFIVVPRKGNKLDSKVQWYLQKPHLYLDKEETKIIKISSSEIRFGLRVIRIKNYPISDDYLEKIYKGLDKKVLKYIKNNNLYN